MLNKVLKGENVMNDVDVFIYKLGLIKRQNESRKYRWIRYFFTSTAILFLIRSVVSMMIYHYKSNEIQKFERYFVWFGDFTYFIPKIRFHLNLTYFLFIIQTTSVQILHNVLIWDQNNQSFYWLKPFEMLAGKLKPSEIGFTNQDDLRVFIRR